MTATYCQPFLTKVKIEKDVERGFGVVTILRRTGKRQAQEGEQCPILAKLRERR